MNMMDSTPHVSPMLADFRARTEHYARMGFDRIASARFVVLSAGELSGPALDVGTGKGVMALALARLGLEVVSVDTSAEEQALAALVAAEAGFSDKIRFHLGDAAQLPFPNNHFGCVAMMDVLHHLDDCAPVMREIARVLRPGGAAIIADFTPEGFDLLARAMREEGREHPVSGVTPQDAEKCLSAEGLRCEKWLTGHLQEVLVFRKTIETSGKERKSQ